MYIHTYSGFTDAELLKLVNEQNIIMDTHEDYSPMRSDKTKGMLDKAEIAKGLYIYVYVCMYVCINVCLGE